MAIPRPALHVASDVVEVNWHGYDLSPIILTGIQFFGCVP